MYKFIALLRAINVGGHNVKMDVLKAHFRELGFTGVETLLASGNVIFESSDANRKRLAKMIEDRLEQELGYAVATFIRTPGEMADIIKYEPFSAVENASATALNVAFLATALDKNALALLVDFETDIDKFHSHGSEVYWMCAIKQSDSKFSNSVFEKKLGIASTFRGMKTVARLAEKYAE